MLLSLLLGISFPFFNIYIYIYIYKTKSKNYYLGILSPFFDFGECIGATMS